MGGITRTGVSPGGTAPLRSAGHEDAAHEPHRGSLGTAVPGLRPADS